MKQNSKSPFLFSYALTDEMCYTRPTKKGYIMEHRKLIILGSGPAGLTSGVYAGRANIGPLLIEGKEPGGQLMGTNTVENWPGTQETTGPQLIQDMREHAKACGTEIVAGAATDIDVSEHPFQVTTTKDTTYTADAVIIATGAKPRRLECPGEEEYWGKGVTTCAVCDGAFFKDKPVVIVGGGDSAMEDAEFMLNFTNDITIVQIEDELTASEATKKNVVDNDNIDIIYNSTVTKIKGDGDDVTGVEITNQDTDETQELETNAVFIAIGFTPNTDMVKGDVELTDYGHIVIYDHAKTSQEGLFVAGDVADPKYQQVVTASGMGCRAAMDAEKYIKRLKK